jgi:hypothetical protein
MKGKYNINFVSSSNKLKLFTDPLVESVVVESDEKSELSSSTKSIQKNELANYSHRKKMGISITKTILSDISSSFYHADNNNLLNWFASHKKKDDLADSFLQGLWYIKTKLKDG